MSVAYILGIKLNVETLLFNSTQRLINSYIGSTNSKVNYRNNFMLIMLIWHQPRTLNNRPSHSCNSNMNTFDSDFCKVCIFEYIDWLPPP